MLSVAQSSKHWLYDLEITSLILNDLTAIGHWQSKRAYLDLHTLGG